MTRTTALARATTCKLAAAADAQPKTYRLGSNPMFYAPGMVAWAINGASFKRDLPQMVNVIAQGWNVPPAAAKALVTKKVPFTVEGETVVFTA